MSKDTASRQGLRQRGSPGAQVQRPGPWEEPISFAQMLDIDTNKLFFNEAAVLSMCQSMPS